MLLSKKLPSPLPPPVPARRTNISKLNRQYACQQNSLYVTESSDYESVSDYRSNQELQNKTQQTTKSAENALNEILATAIPPPSPRSPPPNDAGTDDSRRKQLHGEMIARLNMLFDIQRQRNIRNGSECSSGENYSDAVEFNTNDINEVEEDDDIILRTRPFKDFSRRSKRGSSKAMCSLISVCNFIPRT